MASYRLYYCDAQGKIFAADDFQAVDDGAAVDRARSISTDKSPVFEVWEQTRLVHREPPRTEDHAGNRLSRAS